jgi:hypothetical protein
MIVSKNLEKLEYAIDVAIIHAFTIRHAVGHFADDIKGTKDVPMLFHQNTCGFHGGLLSLPLIMQVAFLHCALWIQSLGRRRNSCGVETANSAVFPHSETTNWQEDGWTSPH